MITLDVMGRIYDVPEPKGAAAMELYTLAMDAMEAKGAGKTLSQMASTPDASAREALGASLARQLGASAVGLHAARRTLLGGKCDGEDIDGAFFEATYSKPGRFSEPYVAAFLAWDRLGFFSAGSASKPKQGDPEGEDPSGAS